VTAPPDIPQNILATLVCPKEDSPAPQITEGRRNIELTRRAGGIVGDIQNLSDQEELEESRKKLQRINVEECSPPLEYSEVETIFWSIVSAEKNNPRRSADGTVKNGCDRVSERCASRDPKTGAPSREPWRLGLVECDPTAYKLYGPPFTHQPTGWDESIRGPWPGFLLLADDRAIRRPGMVCDLATHLGIYLDEDIFSTFWRGTKGNKQKGIAPRPGAVESLMRTLTRERPAAERIRRYVIADAVNREVALCSAADEPSEMGHMVHVGDEWWCRHENILCRITNPMNKITSGELTDLFEDIGARIVSRRIGIRRSLIRFRMLDLEALGNLAKLATAGAIEDTRVREPGEEIEGALMH
jgi:hypothetical protein